MRRGLRLSWPLALGGGFEGQLTGYDNVRFLSRLYDLPFKETFDYVVDFSELGKHMYMPVRFYSDGMRMRLAFALSLAMNFECYLIDEVILVGDRRFQLKCHDELFGRRQHCGMIMAVHDAGVIKEYCQSALILKAGRGRLMTDLDLAARVLRNTDSRAPRFRRSAWSGVLCFKLNLDQRDLAFQRGVLADQTQLDRMQRIGDPEVESQGENAAGVDLEEAARDAAAGVGLQDEGHLLDVDAEAEIRRGVPLASGQGQVGPIGQDARPAGNLDCRRQDRYLARRRRGMRSRGHASTSCEAPGRAVNNGCR